MQVGFVLLCPQVMGFFNEKKIKHSFFRRVVASLDNLLPHVRNEKLSWKDSKWSSDYSNLDLCSQSYFIEPLVWINSITHSESGKILCPKCKAKLGSYNWVMGTSRFPDYLRYFYSNLRTILLQEANVVVEPECHLHFT